MFRYSVLIEHGLYWVIDTTTGVKITWYTSWKDANEDAEGRNAAEQR